MSYSLVQYFSDAVVYNAVEQLQFWESYVLKKYMLHSASHWAEGWRTSVQGVRVKQCVNSRLGYELKTISYSDVRHIQMSFSMTCFGLKKDHL